MIGIDGAAMTGIWKENGGVVYATINSGVAGQINPLWVYVSYL
jgi:hypothetical protein